ncbi:ComEA family DNA-binding protein [Acidobacteriota bacterium]
MNNILKSLVFGLVVAVLFLAVFSVHIQAHSVTPEKKIDINTASVSELQKLPRIGEKVAQRIVDFRKQHGDFKKIEEIMKVKGVGEKTFKLIKDLIVVKTKAKSK